MKGKVLLINNRPEVLRNFESDKHLKLNRTIEFSEFNNYIEYDVNSTIDEYAIDLNNKFFFEKKYQQIGEKVNLNENLGHVVEKEKFFDDFIQKLNEKNKMKALGAINSTKLKERFENKKIDEIKLLYSDISLRKFQMWSFRNPGSNILSGIKKDELSYLLALDDVFLPKFLFEHHLPKSISISKPTAFDAGFMKNWKYGGFTNPIGKYSGHSGLEELVHDFIKIKDLVTLEIIPN